MHNLSKKNNNLHRANLSRLLCASAAFVLVQANNAYANPTGAVVTSGNVNISSPQAGKLVVNQNTDKAVINWNNFDINAGESTQFVQPSSSSVALNRITDGNPTQILGELSANGRLMIVNGNGVFFGQNSRVDVAGLIASTADTTDADFLAGKTNLSIAGKPDAKIVNKGSITAAQGGLVALVAPGVQNDGVIEANLGTVALASTETASVDFYGDNLYSFALDKETSSAAAGIENNGIISANGGKVLLTAKVAKNVVDNVINNTGIIEASSAHMDGGTIVLDGGNGNVKLSGNINVTGKTGGNVTVTGENITLASANIDASGKNGGGTVKIGGDYQGKGVLPHAKTVKADAASKINVSATDSGNGGTAVLWSDENTNFKGTIFGTGGVNGGSGGLAEVSSKGSLGFSGFADLHAANGQNGTLLLDPGSLFLGNVGDFTFLGDDFVKVDATIATLNTGTNVTQTATNNISVLGDIVWNGSGSLTLTAGNDAHIESDIKSTFNGTNTQGAVNINVGNNIYLGNADINTAGGDITANSKEFHMSNSTAKSTNGNVIINNTGKFAASGPVILEGQSVKFFQSADGNIQNAINAVGNVGAGGTLLQLRDGIWNEDIAINHSNFTLNGNGTGNTVINATDPAVSHVIKVLGGNNDVTLSNLAVNGGERGISVADNTGFKLDNAKVTNAYTGVVLDSTIGASITNSALDDNEIAIQGNNTNLTNVANNSFTGNFTALNFNGDTNLTIKDNNFNSNVAGIALIDVVGAPVTGNKFNNNDYGIFTVGDNSLVIDNNEMTDVAFGVVSANSTGIKITNNKLDGNGGTYGAYITGGLNSVIAGNSVEDFGTGIGVENSTETGIYFNTVKNIVGDGIFLNNNTHSLVYQNTVFDAANGIHASNSERTDILENIVHDTETGILADNGDSIISIKRNEVYDNKTGIEVDDADGTQIVDVEDNKVHNNTFGVTINNTDNVILTRNIYTDNGSFGGRVEEGHGLGIFDSDNAVSTDEKFSGNILSILLDNSNDTHIHEASVNVPNTRTGISIRNGSGGTLVRGLDINGGAIGILLDGKGSSMQFESNTSHFTGQGLYFKLQNDAMFAGGSTAQADSLDASQQFFDGVRASDFTPAQLAAAEGITTDVEDGIPTIGNVFYKLFPTPPVTPTPPSLSGLDGLNEFQEFPTVVGLFSYAGRTITNDPSVTPPTFDIPSLNLSLLSGGGSISGTVSTPAGFSPSQLAGLEPAAGGENPQALASLEPAAGGEPNCGNSFLDDGFKTQFNRTSCEVEQNQQ
jgi:filamentous hemagglutinin family protein